MVKKNKKIKTKRQGRYVKAIATSKNRLKNVVNVNLGNRGKGRPSRNPGFRQSSGGTVITNVTNVPNGVSTRFPTPVSNATSTPIITPPKNGLKPDKDKGRINIPKPPTPKPPAPPPAPKPPGGGGGGIVGGGGIKPRQGEPKKDDGDDMVIDKVTTNDEAINDRFKDAENNGKMIEIGSEPMDVVRKAKFEGHAGKDFKELKRDLNTHLVPDVKPRGIQLKNDSIQRKHDRKFNMFLSEEKSTHNFDNKRQKNSVITKKGNEGNDDDIGNPKKSHKGETDNDVKGGFSDEALVVGKYSEP